MRRRIDDEYLRVATEFDADALGRICAMHETEFAAAYDMVVTPCPAPTWGFRDLDPRFYAFKDNGASILAVAHLDTVVDHDERAATFVQTMAGPVVFSGALDDRLGAYTILELLPRLGINVDVLLTTGEESGQSTAEFFKTEKDYHWMIEFDRGGTDVVMYQYEDLECRHLVSDSGAHMGDGSFSDIAFLEHLEIKGFNWGVGYQDYHSTRGHAFIADYLEMLAYFVRFHEANSETYLPHEKEAPRSGLAHLWGDDEDPWLAEGRMGEDAYADVPWDDDDLVSEDFDTVRRHLANQQD